MDDKKRSWLDVKMKSIREWNNIHLHLHICAEKKVQTGYTKYNDECSVVGRGEL